GMIFPRAAVRPNQPARSISGKLFIRFDFGGHSISNVLLTSFFGSKSPSQAKACTSLPLFCRTGLSLTNGPCPPNPVSSVNSRWAVESGSAPASIRPLGIPQAPASFLAQNGPPGWASSTSNASRRRKTSRPALTSDARPISRAPFRLGYRRRRKHLDVGDDVDDHRPVGGNALRQRGGAGARMFCADADRG